MEQNLQEFDKVLKYDDDFALVLEKGKVYKYNFESGEMTNVIPDDDIKELRPCVHGGCILRNSEDGAAYFDADFKKVLDFDYPYLYDIHSEANGLAYGKLFHLGVITFDGKELIEPNYSKILYGDGVYTLLYQDAEGPKTLFIDINGNKLFDPIRGAAGAFKDGICLVRKSEYDYSEAGAIDKKGNYVIPREYTIKPLPKDKQTFEAVLDSVSYFNDDLAPFKKDGKWGYLNTKGECVIPFEFTDANCFSDGLASVKTDKKKAQYINTKGEIVISNLADGGRFAYGFAPATKDTERITPLYGYINTNGEMVIEEQYTEALPFLPQEIAEVGQAGIFGYIDSTGKLILPCEYGLSEVINDVIVLSKKEKYGIFDITGKKLLTCKYCALELLSDKYATCRLKPSCGWNIVKYR